MNSLAKEMQSLDQSIIVIKSAIPFGNYVAPTIKPPVLGNVLDNLQRSNKIPAPILLGVPNSQLLDNAEIKLKVHWVENNIICFESLAYPDHYLDLTPNKVFYFSTNNQPLFTKVNEVPKKEPWARFSIWGQDLTKVGIRSERWTNRWLYVEEPYLNAVLISGGLGPEEEIPSGERMEFEIKFSEDIIEQYEVVGSHINLDDKPNPYTFRYTVGTSRSDGREVEFGLKVSTEVSSNFAIPLLGKGTGKLGSEFHSTWKSTMSSTLTTSTEVTLTLEVPAKKKMIVRQLTGSYGVLRLKSPETLHEVEDLI